MMDILDKIIENKRKEVASQKQTISLKKMIDANAHNFVRPVYSMRDALANSQSGIIAEFKRKSPSKGWIFPDAKIEDIAPAYESGGATACSILTDWDYFGGTHTDLIQARDLVKIPLLRKDFVIDEYQIYQARAIGADAILLIASVLTANECLNFAKKAHELSMNVLLEIHSEKELRCLNQYIDMLGVNNRNLGTFDVSVDNSFRLVEKMKKEAGDDQNAPVLVSESGLSDIQTIRELRNAGFQGFLIGEMFMKTTNPGQTLRQLIEQSLYEKYERPI